MTVFSLIIGLLAILLVFPLLAVKEASVGKFTHVEGNVDITNPGREARRVNPGDPVNVGDIIRSKSRSKCEITFIDGNILRFAENTRLRITEYMLEKEQKREVLNLFRGKIRNIVKSAKEVTAKGGRYEIHTPMAVCSVRGTDFITYHQIGGTGVKENFLHPHLLHLHPYLYHRRRQCPTFHLQPQ